MSTNVFRVDVLLNVLIMDYNRLKTVINLNHQISTKYQSNRQVQE